MGVMPKVNMKNLFIVLILLIQSCFVLADSRDSSSVSESFDQYVSLNKRFVDSVGTSKSKELRGQLETYAEVGLATTLSAAERLVCSEKSLEVVKSLFNLIVSTQNSANEQPSEVLGKMFICQPDLVSTTKVLLKDTHFNLTGLRSSASLITY